MAKVQMVGDLLHEILWYVWQGLRTCRASHTSVVWFIIMVGLARKSSNALACPMMLWTHSAWVYTCAEEQRFWSSSPLCSPSCSMFVWHYQHQSQVGNWSLCKLITSQIHSISIMIKYQISICCLRFSTRNMFKVCMWMSTPVLWACDMLPKKFSISSKCICEIQGNFHTSPGWGDSLILYSSIENGTSAQGFTQQMDGLIHLLSCAP